MILYSVLGVVALVLLFVLWRTVGRAPRRWRGLKRAAALLQQGKWHEALDLVRKLRHIGTPSSAWIERFHDAEGQCLRLAADAALKEKKFEEALGHLVRAAHVLGESEVEARVKVQSAMLDEVRRLFSQTTHGDQRAIHELIDRLLLVQSPSREASFWQGLAYLRGGDPRRALDALQTSRTGEARALVLDDGLGELAQPAQVATPGASFIDPPLYIGAILLRQGQAKEALRFLTEANRVDSNCPVVTVQLGAAMIAAGGDTQLAVRALQRALGRCQQWSDNPARVWTEGFPEGRSYVRKLAAAHPFVCPLWGADLAPLWQQAHLALGQGLYKMGAYQEAADLFTKAIQHGAPSLAVVRGLGLSLARVGKYDDAFKHLRIAHEMEDPKDRITAGYLALCGAMGKPALPEDKPRNIAWAIGLVMQFNAPGDKEWVALINALFHEAREEKVSLGLDEQLYLCEHLVSVNATDPQAAQGYHHLQATFPQAVRSEYAWLYCRAAQEHKVTGAQALALFARTFAEREAAAAFFALQGWSFDDLEFAFLERAAALEPGRFPAILGPDYAPRGEALLLERSVRDEQVGQLEAARADAEILHRLAPYSPRALDRLAQLHYRHGDADQALRLLEEWHAAQPHDPKPLVRLALLLHERNAPTESLARLHAALERSQGLQRARTAFLGARLALTRPAGVDKNAGPEGSGFHADALGAAQHFLEICLRDDPRHPDALWCLAAVRWLRGDETALAQQVSAMDQAQVADPRFRYFAAVCRLAAHDFPGALEVCGCLAQHTDFSVPAPQRDGDLEQVLDVATEAAYLAALAQLGLGNRPAAIAALRPIAELKGSPSASHAQALLGALCFEERRYDEASQWWQKLDAKQRAAWKLGDSLAAAMFLAALQAYQGGRFEEAAEKLRTAGRLGWRERRLGALLVLALFRAGQEKIYPGLVRGEAAASSSPAAPFQDPAAAAPVPVNDSVQPQ